MKLRPLIAALALLLLGTVPSHAWFGRIAGGSAGGGGGSLSLVRTFNQPAGTTTPANAFWMIGQPVLAGSVPSGQIVSATLGGSAVRVADCDAGGPMLHADGSTRWMRLLVDYSGQTITPGGSANLVLTPTAGSWPSTSSRSPADFKALDDTVTLANLTMPGGATGAGYTTPSGTWTADFSNVTGTGTGTIYQTTTVCTSPLGNLYEVKANFVNGSTTHVMLEAAMYYWVTQTSAGALGPVLSWGPFVENMQMYKTTPGEFLADITWLRGGTQQRKQLTVPIIPMTSAVMMRGDGQADWTASDPQVWVGQDYTKVRATQTILPLLSGISYTGNACCTASESITGVSGAIFTANLSGIFEGGFHPAVALEFNGSLGGLGGISLNTTYWACALNGTTFELFDSFTDAQSAWSGTGAYGCGTTGLITPTGTYSSGATIQQDVAPETSGGIFTIDMPGTGGAPSIGVFTEPGVAYLVGNTQAYERTARVTAYQMWSIPLWVINDATGCIPSLMNSAGTPTTGTNCAGGTGLGAAHNGDAWTAGEGTILFTKAFYGTGGPNVPTGITNTVWSPDDGHFTGPDPYYVWLLEGSPYLQDFLVQNGNRATATYWSTGQPYNPYQVAGTGPTFYDVVLASDAANERGSHWSLRDISIGAYAAPQGSPEEAYFQNVLTSNAAYFAAYQTYEGTNYSNLGISANYDRGGIAVYDYYQSGFMHDYGSMMIGLDAALDGEFVPGLVAMANNLPKWLVALYGSSAICPYFSSTYTFNHATLDPGASPPQQYVSSQSLIGFSFNGLANTPFSFSSGSNVVTAAASWLDQTGTTMPIAVNDLVRFANSTQDDGTANPAPSPFVDGTTYCVVSTTGTLTFNVAPMGPDPTHCSAGAGSIITASATATGVGGMMTPWGQTCPPAPYAITTGSSTDSYIGYSAAGLGIAAARGVAGATTAWTNAEARLSPSAPGTCSGDAQYCIGDTW